MRNLLLCVTLVGCVGGCLRSHPKADKSKPKPAPVPAPNYYDPGPHYGPTAPLPNTPHKDPTYGPPGGPIVDPPR
ncbi:MAG: hypothetical protein IT370_12120 [Deltaproteobacteria bacterium]|nr:hypothetical protein [Deltaproteobacteria bacterium]